MTKIASLAMLLLSLVLFAPPAFCQEAGSYSDYHLQAPGFDQSQVNCAAQPVNQYYNPVQQQQGFNQIVSPTQVPQDYQYGGQAYDGGMQQQNFGYQNMPGQNASAYQQQEMALQQTQMAQQLEEVKTSKESQEGFRMSSEFNDKAMNDSNTGAKKIKAKGLGSSMGRLVKGSLRMATPAAGTVASVYLLRAAFGNSMMVMPMGGGMMIAP
ncbi:MAG: hypothetical protein SGJ27_25925 [Candidatus Melainabacteria bacterium]|nr:hypothetical protein [Candidatus Melainabacteria bacterium]